MYRKNNDVSSNRIPNTVSSTRQSTAKSKVGLKLTVCMVYCIYEFLMPVETSVIVIENEDTNCYNDRISNTIDRINFSEQASIIKLHERSN